MFGPGVTDEETIVRLAALAVAPAGCLLLAACGGSSSTGPASPTSEVLQPVPTCTSAVRVPADLAHVVPSATVAPTSVIRSGDALAFTVAAGARVGLLGPSADASGQVLCRAGGAGTSVTLVAVRPGYVRVAVAQPGRRTARVYVKVTV